MEQNTKYKCPRCGNEDLRYIGYINKKPYCRRCISFAGKDATPYVTLADSIPLRLSYPLSSEQKNVSAKVLNAFISGHDVLIHAVTGAGKTELVYATMEYALKHHMSVGFSVPRRDVVIDLYPRIISAFPAAKTIYVVGGHSECLSGDIILLTTHQLYRYKQFFDLLIVDEIDAFPYKGDPVLNRFLLDSVRGHKILLSATPSNSDIAQIKKKGELFEVFARYHHHPLPVPQYIKPPVSMYLSCLKELKRLLKMLKPVLVFVPTINIGLKLYPFIHLFLKKGMLVDSEEEKREAYISAFKKRELDYLVTTSILERGITIKDLQVIVCYADHQLYTKETLIQIAGRAGRKIDAPDGEVIFLGEDKNICIKEAINEIAQINVKAHL